MTIPYQHNCPHSEDSWCLDCVQELAEELESEREDANRFRWLIEKGVAWRDCYSFSWRPSEWLYSFQDARNVIDAAIETEASFSKIL